VAAGAGGKVYIEDRAYDGNHPEGHLAAFLHAAAPGESIGYPPAAGIYLAPRSAADKRDRVYFANRDNQIVCVQDIGYCLQVLARIGKTGTGAGEFKTPLGPFCDGAGTVWVADRNNSRIQRIAHTGSGLAFVWKFGSRGADAARGEFMAPHAVAVSPDGKLLYVAEDNQEYPSRAGGDDPVKGLARVTCYRLSYRHAGTHVLKIGP
jgi:DNA-binding beta-propeller fold protein YncE